MTEHAETYERCLNCCRSLPEWRDERGNNMLVLCSICALDRIDVPIRFCEWIGDRVDQHPAHVRVVYAG